MRCCCYSNVSGVVVCVVFGVVGGVGAGGGVSVGGASIEGIDIGVELNMMVMLMLLVE